MTWVGVTCTSEHQVGLVEFDDEVTDGTALTVEESTRITQAAEAINLRCPVCAESVQGNVVKALDSAVPVFHVLLPEWHE